MRNLILSMTRPLLPRLFPLASCLLAACTTTLPMFQSEDTPIATDTLPQSQAPQRKGAPLRLAPDATYILETDTPQITPQINQSLQAIATRMKSDRSLAVRLESFVPDGGSREMNVSLASAAVDKIRRRLVELGVPSYRIKQAPLGEEHPDAVKRHRSWVELFLVSLPR